MNHINRHSAFCFMNWIICNMWNCISFHFEYICMYIDSVNSMMNFIVEHDPWLVHGERKRKRFSYQSDYSSNFSVSKTSHRCHLQFEMCPLVLHIRMDWWWLLALPESECNEYGYECILLRNQIYYFSTIGYQHCGYAKAVVQDPPSFTSNEELFWRMENSHPRIGNRCSLNKYVSHLERLEYDPEIEDMQKRSLFVIVPIKIIRCHLYTSGV